jgi:Tfp pilus assembly protein PilV
MWRSVESVDRRALASRGETLIESLVAITVLAAVALAALSGLTTALNSTVRNRDLATLEALSRSVAESIQGTIVTTCQAADDYSAIALQQLPAGGGYGVTVTVTFVRREPAQSLTPNTWQLHESEFESLCDDASRPNMHRVEVAVFEVTPEDPEDSEEDRQTERVTFLKRGPYGTA